ncbi:autotransporter assembly complex family protein [Candidatus Halobeggiatoa sp. HSG11]|nr:autotransporter assembly complex family protein [Candidatus Halobeggiatoa sp. HSG11]
MKTIYILLLLTITGISYAADKIEITIEGVEGEILQNVKAYLSIEEQKEHPRLSARRVKRLHKQATKEIKQALQPFGYYQAKIITTDLTESKQTDHTLWQAKYVIELGEPLKIQTVDINFNGDGNKDKVIPKLLANFPIKVGDTLNHPNYNKAKQLLHSFTEERGYFDASITKHKIYVDEDTYTAKVQLDVDTKQRYKFGEVTFEQKLFDEKFLQRFLTFKTDDFYVGSKAIALKNNLMGSDYFATANVNLDRTAANEELQLPVNVVLTPLKPNKYTAGIGYGTDTGVRGSLGWERRYLNRYGHRFSSKLELSEIRQSITNRYTIPLNKLDSFLDITAGYRDETTDISESEVLLLGISKHHSRSIFGTKISEVIGLEYRDERFAIGSDTGHAKLLMPNINWTYIKADNRIYTLKGYRIGLNVRGAMDGFGSNTSVLQTRLDGKFIHKLFKNSRIILRGEMGNSFVSFLDGDFRELPPSIRFFAGGDRSVRGYDYQALGPKNQEGQIVGGKNLLVGSAEYEHKILKDWSLAVFFDVGNAFNDTSDTLKNGAGVGVRWQSPVGLIRLDVAAALSEDSTPIRLHITIGPDL